MKKAHKVFRLTFQNHEYRSLDDVLERFAITPSPPPESGIVDLTSAILVSNLGVVPVAGPYIHHSESAGSIPASLDDPQPNTSTKVYSYRVSAMRSYERVFYWPEQPYAAIALSSNITHSVVHPGGSAVFTKPTVSLIGEDLTLQFTMRGNLAPPFPERAVSRETVIRKVLSHLPFLSIINDNRYCMDEFGAICPVVVSDSSAYCALNDRDYTPPTIYDIESKGHSNHESDI